jgi:hypothetical protein
LRQLPAIERYVVQSDQALLAQGALVPRGYLPQGKWLPLQHWLPVVAPQLLFLEYRGEGAKDTSVVLTLIRDQTLREPNLLLTPQVAWSEYAASAPLIRLQRWSFAANDRREALIRGLPLPPLPGQRLVESAGVAVEAGWTWSPPVDAAVIRRKQRASSDDLLLLRAGPDAQAVVEVVPAASFVKASRSAVRLTTSGAAP